MEQESFRWQVASKSLFALYLQEPIHTMISSQNMVTMPVGISQTSLLTSEIASENFVYGPWIADFDFKHISFEGFTIIP